MYKYIKGQGILRYLKKGWGGSRCRRLARCKLKNEMREGRLGDGKGNGVQIVWKQEEIWEHLWEKEIGRKYWREKEGED